MWVCAARKEPSERTKLVLSSGGVQRSQPLHTSRLNVSSRSEQHRYHCRSICGNGHMESPYSTARLLSARLKKQAAHGSVSLRDSQKQWRRVGIAPRVYLCTSLEQQAHALFLVQEARIVERSPASQVPQPTVSARLQQRFQSTCGTRTCSVKERAAAAARVDD